jgi:hypothetical protein
MKHLKLFEDFQSNFPDVFNKTLIRGSRFDQEEYVDDPSQRKVHLGDMWYDEGYRKFMTNWSTEFNIPDPTKSVHMFFRPTDNNYEKFGNAFEILPQEGARFGFTKQIGSGGLGQLFFKNWDELPIVEYQQGLIDSGMVGSLTYDELIKMSKESGDTLHVWTDSPCLHKKIKKEPTIYKSEPILKPEHFTERGMDNQMKAQFYKEHGKEVRDLPREEALKVLDEFVKRIK